MNEHENMEDSLWDFIDGISSADDKSAIETLIATNLEWKRKYHELLEVHQLMTSSELDEPSMRFTRNVMEEITKHQIAPATRNYINKKIIWGIGGFFVVMIAGFLLYAFSQVSLSAESTTQPAFVNNQINNIQQINWGKFFSSTYTNVFLLINVVLGLVLLDMYLTRKKEQHRQSI